MSVVPTKQILDSKHLPLSPVQSYLRQVRTAHSLVKGSTKNGKNLIRERQITNPQFIGVDSLKINPLTMTNAYKRGIDGFFPSIKQRNISTRSLRSSNNELDAGLHISMPGYGLYYQGNLELAPNEPLTNRYYDKKKDFRKEYATVTIDESQFLCSRCPMLHQRYSNVINDKYQDNYNGDMSYLPRPQNFMARSYSSYIYRHKIKGSRDLINRIVNKEIEPLTKSFQEKYSLVTSNNSD